MAYLIIENRPVGFFSNFNLIAGALNHIRENGIDKFYVFWQNPFYQEQNYNLFDKYFFQQQPIQQFTVQKTAFDLGINILSDIGKEKNTLDFSLFRKLHATLHHFNYFNNEIYKMCKESCVKKEKSLGIHVRQTDHNYHGKLLPLQTYFDAVDEKINQYDNVFIATDEMRVMDAFSKRYGSKIYSNEDIIRSENSDPLHRGKFTQFREKLALDVIKDAISLSLCDEIIMTSSNITYYVFMLNPNLTYTKIDWHIEQKN